MAGAAAVACYVDGVVVVWTEVTIENYIFNMCN